MLADPDGLSSALSKNLHIERGRDLLGFFVNYENPVTAKLLRALFNAHELERGWRQTVYLGYLPLLLVAIGLANARKQPRTWLWLALLLLFLLLRLGSNLAVNNLVHDSIRLPKFYLAQILPQVFQPFWTTDQFYAGALFPLALLCCYGMKALLRRLPANRRAPIILAATAFIALEYYQAPDPLVIPPDQLALLSRLKQSEKPESINLIHLPMGGNVSKIYDFYQTWNGFPQVEGRPTRAPASAYDYIEANLLLRQWSRRNANICLPASRPQFLASLRQLEADGFTHFVYHHWLGGQSTVAASFTGIQPSYENPYVRVYPIARLADSCELRSLPLSAAFAHIADLAFSPALEIDEAMSILSYHPSEVISFRHFRQLSSAFLHWKRFAHAFRRDGELQVQLDADSRADLNRFLTHEKLFLLLYNPEQTGATGPIELREALAMDYQACPPVIHAPNLIAAYYPRRGFDCALLTSDDRFKVDYAADLQLANLLYNFAGGMLTVESWWTSLPKDAHGLSIQLFNAEGAKVAGGDQLLHHHSLARHRLDLSALEPGDYQLRLIVYHSESGKSVPGLVSASQSTFQRDLNIGSITVE